MSVKLIGVPGAKLLTPLASRSPDWSDEEKATQDFVLINNPRFFIPDVDSYLSFTRASDSGSTLRLAGFFLAHPRLFLIVREVSGHPISSPLEIGYHSMTPYLLGSREDGIAVKYRIDPVSCRDGSPIVQDETRARQGDDFLRSAMRERLAPGSASGDVCFDVAGVVFRGDSPPIEDATREWTANETDPVRLGRLTIPLQEFDSDEQMKSCEALSFTPWHALPEHQPLGGLNRVRLPVYMAVSRLRHQLNGVQRAEPTSAPLPSERH